MGKSKIKRPKKEADECVLRLNSGTCTAGFWTCSMVPEKYCDAIRRAYIKGYIRGVAQMQEEVTAELLGPLRKRALTDGDLEIKRNLAAAQGRYIKK